MVSGSHGLWIPNQVASDVFCFSATFLLFGKTFLEKSFRRVNVTKLTRRLVTTLIGLQQTLGETRDALMSSLEPNQSSDSEVDADEGNGEVSLARFTEAAGHILETRGMGVSHAALEALFFTLKLVHGDDDEHALEMSADTRNFLVTRSGIPLALVSPTRSADVLVFSGFAASASAGVSCG